MSVCLRAKQNGEVLEITWATWLFLLDKAHEFGWQPAGTQAKWENWTGTYFTNDGQIISDIDADQLCQALRRYLGDGEKDMHYDPEIQEVKGAARRLILMAVKAPLVIE